MKFKFVSPSVEFSCKLTSTRCTSETKDGSICRRRSCIGTKYCWTHLLRDKKLRIKDSDVLGAGKGMFAMDLEKGDRGVVFKARTLIVAYDGDVIDETELEARYGEYTGPYAVKLYGNLIEDAACHRGPGSILNHSNTPNCEMVTEINNTVGIYALKNITNNKELLVDYGDTYMFDGTHTTR